MRFAAVCPDEVTTLEISYSLFADLDPQHRGLLRLEHGVATRTAIFGPERATQSFELAKISALTQLSITHVKAYGTSGSASTISCSCCRCFCPRCSCSKGDAGRRSRSFPRRSGRIQDCHFVHRGSFDHAESRALGVISLPSRLVESAIATSVVLAALNNVFPLVHGRRWMVAFAFGLIHGSASPAF